MPLRLLSSPAELASYDAWVRSHPQGALWQSIAWKRFQEACGRETRLYCLREGDRLLATALVIVDRTQLSLRTWEIPRGPLWAAGKGEAASALLEHVVADAKKSGCMTLHLSPFRALPAARLPLRASSRHVHPEASRLLDLTRPEKEILAQMKPKGRYNIHVAQKHGIVVSASDDADAFAMLATETGRRDGFTPHGAAYYRSFLQQLEGSFLLLAYGPHPSKMPQDRSESSDSTHTSFQDEKPLAGLLGVIWEKTGLYYYGASSYEDRALMAPYLLQWEALRLCKEAGCLRYDLFGVAPEGAANHPWAGVSDFKSKFGGTYVEYPPERQMILKPMAHTAIRLKRRVLG